MEAVASSPFGSEPEKTGKIFKKIGQGHAGDPELTGRLCNPSNHRVEIDDVGMVIRGSYG
jgi:hypothetical protein